MLRTLLRVLVIALAGAALGLVHNAASSKHIPYIAPPKTALDTADFISLDEAWQLWLASGGFFLDARSPADYAAGHIPGAYSLSPENFDVRYPQVATMFTLESRLVVYCDGMQCDLSHDLTTRLRQLGYRNVRILQNGWTVWHKAGFETATGNPS